MDMALMLTQVGKHRLSHIVVCIGRGVDGRLAVGGAIDVVPQLYRHWQQVSRRLPAHKQRPLCVVANATETQTCVTDTAQAARKL